MEAKLDDQRQSKKEKGQCSIRREQHKPEKGNKTKTKQRTKKPIRSRNGNGRIKKSLWRKRECTSEAEIFVDLDHGSTPFDMFQMVTEMNELLEIIVRKTNRYTTLKGRNFETTEDEMKAFFGINFIMSINKLSSLVYYWTTDKFIENEMIQNVMTRTRFQSILQNLHFSNNGNGDKTDKSYKIRPVIEHLNKVFAEILSNSPLQSADEHMCKFKGRSSMKQYIKNKPTKWGFKYWYTCDSETDYVYQLELY